MQASATGSTRVSSSTGRSTAGTLTSRNKNSTSRATLRPGRAHSVMYEFYERGDLPVSVDRPATHPSGGSLIWEVCPSILS